MTNVQETMFDMVVEEKIVKKENFFIQFINEGYSKSTISEALLAMVSCNLVFIKDGFIYHNASEQPDNCEADIVEEIERILKSNSLGLGSSELINTIVHIKVN